MNNNVSFEISKLLNWQGETEKVWYEDCDGELIFANRRDILVGNPNLIFKAPSITELLEELKHEIKKIYYSKSAMQWEIVGEDLFIKSSIELVEALAELYIKLNEK
jgi:hypothetical protein